MKHVAGTNCSFVVGVLWAATLLAGCSEVKTYPNMLDKNLHVLTAMDSGSFFSSVRAAVDVHRLNTDCTGEYEGTVQLNSPAIDIGIPANRWSHLVFVFSSSSFWANRRGTISYETLLKPQAGYHYFFRVTYQDDQYNVAIRETPHGSPISRDIEWKDPRVCPPK